MAPRRYEGSAADNRQDAKEAKAAGMSKAAFEKSGRDKADDAAGQRRIDVKSHHRKPPERHHHHPAPTPGPHEFNADQERGMRQQARQARGAMPTDGGPQMDTDADQDTDGAGPDQDYPGGGMPAMGVENLG